MQKRNKEILFVYILIVANKDTFVDGKWTIRSREHKAERL